MRIRAIILMSFLSGIPFTASAQFSDPLQNRYWNELRDEMKALQNPAQVYSNVKEIKSQLVQSSGKNFPIFPIRTTGFIGIAQNGGTILIDGSTLGKPKSVLAFWLAHEWAHQAMSHSINAYSDPKDIYTALVNKRAFPSANEDAADGYAAGFLATYNYPVMEVLSNLCSLPSSSGTHSSGQVRAAGVAAIYSARTGRVVTSPCSTNMAVPDISSMNTSSSRSAGFARRQARHTYSGNDDTVVGRVARNTVSSQPSGGTATYQANDELSGSSSVDNKKTNREVGKKAYFDRDYVTAKSYLNPLCKNGDFDSCYYAGVATEKSGTSTATKLEAAQLYKIGCEGDKDDEMHDYQSCLTVSYLIASGQVANFPNENEGGFYTRENGFNELEYFCDEEEDGFACAVIGGMLMLGSGVEKDTLESMHYLEKSCTLKERLGCSHLSLFYSKKRTIKADPAQAEIYKTLSCRYGMESNCPE